MLMLVNVDGEAFMHPLETRDVAAASIIRECTARGKGVTNPNRNRCMAGYSDDRGDRAVQGPLRSEFRQCFVCT